MNESVIFYHSFAKILVAVVQSRSMDITSKQEFVFY